VEFVRSAPGVGLMRMVCMSVSWLDLVWCRASISQFDGVRPLDKLETENKLHCCMIDGCIRLLEPEPGLHP
jgi:hypothetical protein